MFLNYEENRNHQEINRGGPWGTLGLRSWFLSSFFKVTDDIAEVCSCVTGRALGHTMLTVPCAWPIKTWWGSQVSVPFQARLQMGTGPTLSISGVNLASRRSSGNAGCPLAPTGWHSIPGITKPFLWAGSMKAIGTFVVSKACDSYHWGSHLAGETQLRTR